MTCINCGTEGNGHYCSNCGQRLEVKRITFKEGWHDFWARIYGFDGMFPRTLKDLTFRPGFAARKFIAGNRAAYYGPVGYFFLMITLFLLLLSIIDLPFLEYMRGVQETMAVGKRSKLEDLMQEKIADNIKIFLFLLIPLQAWAARYLFFRKSGLNFIEHTVLPFYATGHLYWFSMIRAVIYKFTGSQGFLWLDILISSAFFGFAYTSYIPGYSKVKGFLKGFMVYWVGYIGFVVVFSLLMIVVVIILATLNPELFNDLRPSGTH